RRRDRVRPQDRRAEEEGCGGEHHDRGVVWVTTGPASPWRIAPLVGRRGFLYSFHLICEQGFWAEGDKVVLELAGNQIPKVPRRRTTKWNILINRQRRCQLSLNFTSITLSFLTRRTALCTSIPCTVPEAPLIWVHTS